LRFYFVDLPSRTSEKIKALEKGMEDGIEFSRAKLNISKGLAKEHFRTVNFYKVALELENIPQTQ